MDLNAFMIEFLRILFVLWGKKCPPSLCRFAFQLVTWFFEILNLQNLEGLSSWCIMTLHRYNSKRIQEFGRGSRLLNLKLEHASHHLQDW